MGLWPAEEAVLRDRRLQAVVGADHYTSSPREAVPACVEEAHKANAAEPQTTGGQAAGMEEAAHIRAVH